MTRTGIAPCPACHGTGREFTVCSRHTEMLKPQVFVSPRMDPDTGLATTYTEPPALRLADLLRCSECGGEWCSNCGDGTHPAITEAMEWAERLGFDVKVPA